MSKNIITTGAIVFIAILSVVQFTSREADAQSHYKAKTSSRIEEADVWNLVPFTESETFCNDQSCASVDDNATLKVDTFTYELGNPFNNSPSLGSDQVSTLWGNSGVSIADTSGICAGGNCIGLRDPCTGASVSWGSFTVDCSSAMKDSLRGSGASVVSLLTGRSQLGLTRATAQIDWPTISAEPAHYYNPGTGSKKWLFAGFEYSLTLKGYDWTPLYETLSAGASATATIRATPTKVVWDLGPNNNSLGQHTRPTTLTCTGPGDSNFGSDVRHFLDWQTYEGYKQDSACKYVWWGLSRDQSQSFTITAQVHWDITLHLSSRPEPIEVGIHKTTHETKDWWVTMPSGAATSPKADS